MNLQLNKKKIKKYQRDQKRTQNQNTPSEMMFSPTNELSKIEVMLKKNKWVLVGQNNHRKYKRNVELNDGMKIRQTLTMSTTPSDTNWHKNAFRDLIRLNEDVKYIIVIVCA